MLKEQLTPLELTAQKSLLPTGQVATQATNKGIFATRKSPASCESADSCLGQKLNCASGPRTRGFGLVEIIVAASVLSVSMLAVSTYFHTTLKMSRATGDGNQASYLLEEGVEALKLMRDTGYASNLLSVSTTSPRYFEWSSTSTAWLATTTDILIDGEFERKFTISDVFRDNTTFDISTSTTGVTYDPNVKLATVKVTWLSGSAGAGKLTPLSPAYVATGSAGGCAAGLGLAVSPDSRFVYGVASSTVAGLSRFHVYTYSRNMSTGALTKIFDTETSVQPPAPGYINIYLSPDGASAYVTLAGTANLLLQYSRNASTGALTPLSPASIVIDRPDTISFSPDGKSAYVLSESGLLYLFNRNTSTGVLTAMSPASYNVVSCGGHSVVTSDGRAVYTTSGCSGLGGNVSQFTRNTSTGALTYLGMATFGGGYIQGITASPDGNFLYVASPYDDWIYMYKRDIGTNLLTYLSPTYKVYAGNSPMGITISPDGFFAYVIDYNDSMLSQYSRDVTTGVLTPLSPASVPSAGISIRGEVSPDGNSLYVANWCSSRINQYSRDPGITVRTIQTYITNLFSN